MTLNKKLSLAFGTLVIVVAAGTALAQNAQNSAYQAVPAPTAATTQTTVPTNSTTSAPTSGSYTLAQVAQHSTQSSCWTAINGGVYDLTSWIDQHPGGPEAILSICGTDGSQAFDAQHGGQRRPEQELASFQIGTLAQ